MKSNTASGVSQILEEQGLCKFCWQLHIGLVASGIGAMHKSVMPSRIGHIALTTAGLVG